MDFETHFSDDGGRRIEWGRTAADYAEHRPNYPDEFYRRLADRGIGVDLRPPIGLEWWQVKGDARGKRPGKASNMEVCHEHKPT